MKAQFVVKLKINKYTVKMSLSPETESIINNIITLHSGPLTCKQQLTTGRVLGYFNHYIYCYMFI